MTDQLPGDIFAVGQVLNNTYQIIRILGRGGTGEVYLAANKITGRQVAIKALSRNFSGNADYIELMKREEQIRAIQHDAVVRYTECSLSDDGHVFLVMDFVDGQPLSDEMARRQMAPRELLIILHRVLEGLEATHNKGIIHRDLSPDNIILKGGDPAEATIIDFGIAKDTAAGARTIVGSDFAGKYEYSAPEQFEGKVDARSDLYALGATILAAFRGETPFPRATPGEIVRRKQSPLDTKGLPESLKGMVEKLTAPDPAQRPASAAAILPEVSALLMPGKSESPGKRRKRRPAMPVLAVLALGAAGFGVWQSDIFLPPPTETYRLALSFDPNNPPILTSHAPSDEDAAQLRRIAAEALGEPPGGEVTIARGMPAPEWIENAGTLISRVAILENAEVDVTERTARITGLAADLQIKATVADSLRDFASATGWRVDQALIAGPINLSHADLRPSLDEIADCGTLALSGEPGVNFGLTDQITVTGSVSNVETRDAITARLLPLIGERSVLPQVDMLNPQLCAIRQVLAEVPEGEVSILLSNGETGARNLSGVFTTDQNPVVDIMIPDTFADGALWVMAVNPDGSLFHLLPNINNNEYRIRALAEDEGGLQRIRVLHSIPEFAADNSRLATRIGADNYGKTDIVAILSTDSLFDGLYPTTMSVAATVEALQEVMETRPQNIRAVRYAIIDARP